MSATSILRLFNLILIYFVLYNALHFHSLLAYTFDDVLFKSIFFIVWELWSTYHHLILIIVLKFLNLKFILRRFWRWHDIWRHWATAWYFGVLALVFPFKVAAFLKILIFNFIFFYFLRVELLLMRLWCRGVFVRARPIFFGTGYCLPKLTVFVLNRRVDWPLSWFSGMASSIMGAHDQWIVISASFFQSLLLLFGLLLLKSFSFSLLIICFNLIYYFVDRLALCIWWKTLDLAHRSFP